ncbi:MAG TPA: hypothetical protein PLB18_14380, partial [Acidobacteriota bacterium]|nr:hypothetical protein [Acidobacteriota bacterium]
MDTPPNFQSSLTPSDHSVIQSDSDSPGWPNWLPGGRQIRPVLLATLLLGALILMGFGMARDYAWLKFDTEKYILEDRAIRILDWEHISSIFSTYYFINYNPLHRLSYAIDYAIWGFDPGGFRTTNLLLHWTAGVFVFLCFYELTRRLTPAWLASICFVIHPTRVESVVWLAQRKDVLSAAFGFATLWMYLRTWRPRAAARGELPPDDAARPGPGRAGHDVRGVRLPLDGRRAARSRGGGGGLRRVPAHEAGLRPGVRAG